MTTQPFFDFLSQRILIGGFTTEDVLATFLPLLKDTLEWHSASLVAPLDRVEFLNVEGGKLRYSGTLPKPIRANPVAVEELCRRQQGGLNIVSEERRILDVQAGEATVERLDIGEFTEPMDRPKFLPGYVCWEHVLGHHDPLSDTFVLGLILASLACSLDLRRSEDLELFVENRRNLFAIRPDLHPVIAREILRMTELNRHDRAQDLAAVAGSLAHYREQSVELDLDLAKIPGFNREDLRTKEQLILAKLRERLFELSRRNRLLHFHSNLQTINLTHASVPLSLDVQNIRPDQILIWNEELQKSLSRGDSLSLNQSLNFAEAIYLPAALDRLIAETKRDATEYGFAQLRLVLCFLHWADLKASPIEHYDSPLVLLPVKLVKKKGVRDSYLLEPLDDRAEVNPVLRHLFKQLYGIELPESISLAVGSLDEFHTFLSARVRASEPAVVVNKLDRPRIELVHERAKRRLDQYQRTAQTLGRGVRSYFNLEYSYDPANYRPLGIQLFNAWIRTRPPHLQELLQQTPTPRAFVGPEQHVVEEQRSFFHIVGAQEENPYVWNFDLCNLTLANFRYRKMSLMRDYDVLLNEFAHNPAFDAAFALSSAGPAARNSQLTAAQTTVAQTTAAQTATKLEETYHVVPCDPTQEAAISAAREGQSYIIQGPPGTGKSQTITNLIADFVARGKRVVFVCEKRAAIDVVYARLRHCGLGPLCCLIHDSQGDKKSFVLDLKQTYESFLSDQRANERERKDVIRSMNHELRGLAQFHAAMVSTPDSVSVEVRNLLNVCLKLSRFRPRLTELDLERLPDYALWATNRDAINEFAERLLEFQPDGILAHHPLRFLSPKLADQERPMEFLTRSLEEARRHLAATRAAFQKSGVAAWFWEPIEQARRLIEFAKQVAPLTMHGALRLLDSQEALVDFDRSLDELHRLHDILAQAQEEASGWRIRIPPRDLPIALRQAGSFEGTILAMLRPAWWRLRSLLNRSYDFAAHVVKPSWVQVLEWLDDEYDAVAALERHRSMMAQKFGLRGNVEELATRFLELRENSGALPDWLRSIRDSWVSSENAAPAVEAVLQAEKPLEMLLSCCDRFMEDYSDLELHELDRVLEEISASAARVPEFLFCIRQLAQVPAPLAAAFRQFRLNRDQLESASAERTLEYLYRSDRNLHNFTWKSRDRHAERLETLYDEWLSANSQEILTRVRTRFRENYMSGQSSTGRGSANAEMRKRFAKGCRDLEHEFGKSMRFKAIRDLVAAESGEVIKQLKPVWLMSPLSVADSLPLDHDQFDVVIFDEASQVTLEEAVPPLFRSQQVIVVGDEKQLPPTDFFTSKRGAQDDELAIEEDGEPIPYDLESDSFLNHAAKSLPSWMLGWHYRSRSESLISFSNWAFYEGRLLTAPEEHCVPAALPEILPASVEDGGTLTSTMLERPLSFHYLAFGVYESRRNVPEARYIAELVRGLLMSGSKLTIGIVAFSEAQQSQIELALQDLAREDEGFRNRLEAEFDREDDGQFVGLLVKNLENMQGDERDIVILSVCYGPGPNGRMLMNFGPINRSGGEKRLNVAFSRAKKFMAVVSSIRSESITNDYNDGANCLKNYLKYCEARSKGDQATSDRVLRSLAGPASAGRAAESSQDPLVEQLATALEQRGLVVDRAVGQSHFRCDLAIRNPNENRYQLGVLVDHDDFYSQNNLLEREVQRPRLLRDFGWRVAIVLRKDWHRDRQAVINRLVALL